ncbi:MAG: hypothetical protein N7Q72_05290, partial [Spiroplasma sp. Tabriz.8]|nr:hypothetical protein [Spiroplasma sp. Tabriz.8]
DETRRNATLDECLANNKRMVVEQHECIKSMCLYIYLYIYIYIYIYLTSVCAFFSYLSSCF